MSEEGSTVVPEEEVPATSEEAGAEPTGAAEAATPEDEFAATPEEAAAAAAVAAPEGTSAVEFEQESSGMSTIAKIAIGVLVALALCMCCAIGIILVINVLDQGEPTAVPSVAVPSLEA